MGTDTKITEERNSVSTPSSVYYPEGSNSDNTNCPETSMDAGYVVVQIADF